MADTITKQIGAVSAYALAVEGGYTGTEAEFKAEMAGLAENAQQVHDDRIAADLSAANAASSETNAASAAKAAEKSQESAETEAASAQLASESANESKAAAANSADSASASQSAAETASRAAADSAAAAEAAQAIAEDAAQGILAAGAVLYTEQPLTEQQQTQARVNINAARNNGNDELTISLLIDKYGMNAAFKSYIEANLEYDSLTQLCERFFAAAAKTVNETYTSRFYKYEVSGSPLGEKLDDNTDLVCEPSTNTFAGQDDYANLPLFACYDCNYTIDAETLEPVIHAVKGIGEGFSSAPDDSLVGVMQMTGWSRRTSDETYKTVEYRAQEREGFRPLPEAVRASDNSVRPFVIHAKYAAGYNSAGLLSSVSGVQPATYRPGSAGSTSIGHNGQIALWLQWGLQYCGSSLCDIAFIQIMLEIKYATLGSASIMSGCRDYYTVSAVAAVSESGVNRIVLTASNANYFVVGSRASIGTSTNRANAACYDVHDIATIKNIEDVTIDGTAYKAVVLDTEAVFNIEAGVHYLIPQPWATGSTDDVQGNDGSPISNTSGKELCKIQGIEVMLGMYEVLGDTTLYEDAQTGYTVYSNRKAADITSNNSGKNPITLGIIPKEAAAAWKYNAELNWDANDQESYMIPTQFDGTSTTGYRAATYRNALATVGWREWPVFGSLSNGANCGIACTNANNGLGGGYWHFGARALGSGGNRGEFTPTQSTVNQ